MSPGIDSSWPPPAGLAVFHIDGAGAPLALLTYEIDQETELVKLSNAERDVMRAVLEGKSNAEIARERGTAPRTVANQVAKLFEKLGVRSRTELAARLRLRC